MSVESLAEAEATEQNDETRYEELVGRLDPLGDVAEVEVREDRSPVRVAVVLDAANVTGPVSDLLDQFEATVVRSSIEVTADGALSFEATTPEGFKNAGTRDARRYGDSSVSFTFTRESLDLSGIDVGDTLDVSARNGAVLLTEHEG